jgi:hypothetical protein
VRPFATALVCCATIAAPTCPGNAAPPPDALVDGGKRLARDGGKARLCWIRPADGQPGLSDTQFDEVLATLQRGWPIAAGWGYSRLLVGYRAAGNGAFLTLDSALAVFAGVPPPTCATDGSTCSSSRR